MSFQSILVHAFRWIQPPTHDLRTEAWFVIRHSETGEPNISQVFQNPRQNPPPGFTFAGPSCALVGSSLYVIGQTDNPQYPRLAIRNQISYLDILNQVQGWKQCNPLPFHCKGTKPYVLCKFIYLFPSSDGGCFMPIHDRQIPWGLLYDTIEQKCYKIEPPSGLDLHESRNARSLFLDCIECEPEAAPEDDPYQFYSLRGSDAESDTDSDSASDGDGCGDADSDYCDAQTPRCPPPFCVPLNGADPRLIVSIPVFLRRFERHLYLHNPVKNEWEPYLDDHSSHREFLKHHAILNGILYSCDISCHSNVIYMSAYDISQGWRRLFAIHMRKPKNLNFRCGSVSLVAIADFQLCLLWVKANRVRSKKNVLCYTKIVVSVDPSRAPCTFSEEKFLEIEANGLLSCLPC